MENERTMRLSIEQAVECYRQGGFIRELALQAYTEEELKEHLKPQSWDEFCEKVRNKISYSIVHDDGVVTTKHSGAPTEFLNEDTAKSVSALCKLINLRECWVDGWIPNWDSEYEKYVIEVYKNEVETDYHCYMQELLSFPTKDMRDMFFEAFKDLIEQAKPFL